MSASFSQALEVNLFKIRGTLPALLDLFSRPDARDSGMSLSGCSPTGKLAHDVKLKGVKHPPGSSARPIALQRRYEFSKYVT